MYLEHSRAHMFRFIILQTKREKSGDYLLFGMQHGFSYMFHLKTVT
jgi:hypothetical protein